MASSFASYASWLSVDDTEPPKSVEPPKSAEPPKSVDQVGWVELATQATQTDEDPLDYRWDGSTWLGPGDWETDPVDIIPVKSEVGGVMKLSHPNDSQQPQDEAEPPKPPTKRQRRSGSNDKANLDESLSQPVEGSQSQPVVVDGSQSQGTSSQVVDGSQSQPVVDGSKSQPVHGLRSEQKTLARQLMLAVLPGLGPAAAEPPKPPTREVVDGSQSQPVDGSQSQQIDWATVSVVVIDGSQSQPVVDGS